MEAKKFKEQPDSPHHLEDLKKVELFKDLAHNEEALKALSSVITEKFFRPRVDIIQESTEGTEMFILIEGKAAVYKTTPGGDLYKVAILNGEHRIAFGESGLIESEKRTATIKSEDECHCLVLDRHAFEIFSQNHPAWALPIYRRIATSIMTRLRKTNDDMLLLYNALVSEIRGH